MRAVIQDLEASRKLNEQLGIDSKQDLHGLVVGIYPGPDGKVAEKNCSSFSKLSCKTIHCM